MDFGESGGLVLVEVDGRGDGRGAVGDADVEGGNGVVDLDGDGANAEAVLGREVETRGAIEGGDGGCGCGVHVFHGGQRRRIRSCEEKTELAGAEEIGCVGQVTRG